MRRFFISATLAAAAAFLPASVFASDQETAQQIADALRSSGRLKDYSIGVKFAEGKAYLLGRVASEQQSREAVEMATNLPYVTSVENHLEVKSSAKQDFAVEQAGHQSGGSRRTVQRDQMLFGSEQSASRKPAEMTNEDAAPAVPTAAQLELVEHTAPAPMMNDMPVRSAPLQASARSGAPIPTAAAGRGYARQASHQVMSPGMGPGMGSPIPSGVPASSMAQRVAYDKPNMPCYAWPSYAAHPNYAGVTYPNQYSAAAWPYIGPFYPYPQVPLGWRKVTMEWKDGWWWLDFNDHCRTFRR